MEPAGNRQQDVGPLNGYDLMIVKPQRGPPIIGREHVQPIPAGDESVLRAAMEPATEEREHTRTGVGEPQGFLPQWSPPLTGGNTDSLNARGLTCSTPQWSPPVIGGSTNASIRHRCRSAPRRNGARLPSAGVPGSGLVQQSLSSCRNGAHRRPAGIRLREFRPV
jgi:hypothetical protein